MGEALKEARRAAEEGEVPVGAVAVTEGRIIARAHNQVELLKDATAHAEMIALTQASSYLGDWRLERVTLYVTKEPCPMCAGALRLSRVSGLVYGARDEKAGAAGSAWDLLEAPRLGGRILVEGGVREEECASLLKAFFHGRRGDKKEEETG